MHEPAPNVAQPSETSDELIIQVEQLSSLDPAEAVEPTADVLRELGQVLDEG